MKKEPSVLDVFQWLKEHDIADKLQHYYTNTISAALLLTFDQHITENKSDLIIRTMVFEKTDEGFDFWWSLHRKFQSWYLNFNNS